MKHIFWTDREGSRFLRKDMEERVALARLGTIYFLTFSLLTQQAEEAYQNYRPVLKSPLTSKPQATSSDV